MCFGLPRGQPILGFEFLGSPRFMLSTISLSPYPYHLHGFPRKLDFPRVMPYVTIDHIYWTLVSLSYFHIMSLKLVTFPCHGHLPLHHISMSPIHDNYLKFDLSWNSQIASSWDSWITISRDSLG